jgi:SnoaL-like domain
MQNDRRAAPEWTAFIAKLEAAEHEFAQGRPAAFKALWSHSDEVSLCGGFGGMESGWDNVGARLDWASSQISEGTRSSEEIRSTVGADFAYIVQTEQIRFRVPGRAEQSTVDFRVTMVFRRDFGEWRIIHRHADSQMGTKSPH